jgi:hypothetical protein
MEMMMTTITGSEAFDGKVNIYLAGALNIDGTRTGLQELLNAQHSFGQTVGYSTNQDMNLMIEQALGVYAWLAGSAIPTQHTRTA